jgi:hypothetical protein
MCDTNLLSDELVKVIGEGTEATTLVIDGLFQILSRFHLFKL